MSTVPFESHVIAFVALPVVGEFLSQAMGELHPALIRKLRPGAWAELSAASEGYLWNRATICSAGILSRADLRR
jgi:hypothetical protein